MPPRRSRHEALQNEQQQPQTDHHQEDSAIPQSDNQDQQQAQVTENGNAKGKGKGKANQEELDAHADADDGHQPQAEATSTSTSTSTNPAPVTMQDRMEKMKQLKQKMVSFIHLSTSPLSLALHLLPPNQTNFFPFPCILI